MNREAEMQKTRQALPLVAASVLTIPGIYLHIADFLHISPHLAPGWIALVSGMAILGASFLLLWACDAVQVDVSASLALAFVALVAVLPEYAVDMYFTWEAGQRPGAHYASYSVANMTGANRLLIGIGWSLIALIVWIRFRKPVQVSKDRRTEIIFLAIATLYAFIIPLKNSLCWYDGLVFLGIYFLYLAISNKRPECSCEFHGPAGLIVSLPKHKRRMGTVSLFLFAAIVIGFNAEPFSEGLIGMGRSLGINEFLLVQWLAPVASEAPEFIVALMFAIRGEGGMALGSLLSSKLNQWTLLVGMIPGVYAVSAHTLSHPIPMGSIQIHEIMLTAAQSLLAIVILANLRLTVGQGFLLFWLFMGQFLAPVIHRFFPFLIPWGLSGEEVHELFSLIYGVTAVALILDYPGRLHYLKRPFHCKCDEDATEENALEHERRRQPE